MPTSTPPYSSLTRRALLIGSAAAVATALLAACGGRMVRGGERDASDDAGGIVVSARTSDGVTRPVEFSTVGVFDVDALAEPGFARLLDNLAASPGAFGAVRFFGSLNSGAAERTVPTGSGIVWPDPAAPMDFSATFAGLEALTTRGLTPFLQLSFFPAAVSPSPTLPPASFDCWQTLVRAFLDALVADRRFGPEAIRAWWFEVWNEPNIPVFWQGTFAHYLDLYRATSDVVRATGYPIRLGGPALAYLPATEGAAAGAPLMQQFLQFLRDEPGVQCDFLSFHEKGTWAQDAPALRDLTDAAETTARMARLLVPGRCAGLPIINNEADMKVGFDTPYEPRMDARFPAWLASVLVAHDDLSARHRDLGIRFHVAADDANLQLIQSPFDGRRAMMTRASPDADDALFKLPVYHFYELLRLLGDRRGAVVHGDAQCWPRTDLFHLTTVADDHAAALFAVYPTPGLDARPPTVAYTLADLPWPMVNIARFQIDATHSNAYTAAGARLSPPFPDAASAARIRQAQELALSEPIARGVSVADGAWHTRFTIDPFTTLLYWITPTTETVPAAPRGLTATPAGGVVILRWEPSRDPSFFSYAVFAMRGDEPDTLLSPDPLRSALWVDTVPPPGPRRYGVRTISASGVVGPLAVVETKPN